MSKKNRDWKELRHHLALQRRAEKSKKRWKRWKRDLNRRRAERGLSVIEPQPKAIRTKRRFDHRKVLSNPKGPDYIVRFPPTLSFIEKPDPTLHFFQQLRTGVFDKVAHGLLLEHPSIKRITPEAALVLIAEFNLLKCFSPHLNLATTGNLTDVDPMAARILSEIGYWEHFGAGLMLPPMAHGTNRIAHFVEGNSVDGATIKKLLQQLNVDDMLGIEPRHTLYTAIAELVDNVLHHAYPRSAKKRNRVFIDHWWAFGYCDPPTRQISFSVYDQGVGIPATIRTRISDILPFLSPSDEDIIIEAVLHGGYSRYKEQPTRGQGLPSLKDVYKGWKHAELYVITNNSLVKFSYDHEPQKIRLASPLNGTLITWNLWLPQP